MKIISSKYWFFPLIGINGIIALFIQSIQPYSYVPLSWVQGFLFWFLAFHSGYVLNHLGVIFIAQASTRMMAWNLSSKSHPQTLLISLITAIITSLPLSLIVHGLSIWLNENPLNWQTLYFRCLIWNVFIMFSYGIWLQKNLFESAPLSLNRASVMIIVGGLANVFDLFKSPKNTPIEASSTRSNSYNSVKSQVPDGIKQLLPVNLMSAQTIIYIQADNHYLHVKTEKGKAFIRLRLKDAIAMMNALPTEVRAVGTQVHRSYWVNFDYVKQASSRELVLTDGMKIPISKKQKETVLATLKYRQN